MTRKFAAALAALPAFLGPARAGDSFYLADREGVVLLTNVPSAADLQPLSVGTESLPPVRGMAPYLEIIREAAARYGLREEVLLAVIGVESGFRAGAVSPKGAMGLMQLMPETAAALGVTHPFDPRQNILAGARHLRALLDRFHGDLRLALAAYNAGATRVSPRGAVPEIPETRTYVRRVLDRLGPGFGPVPEGRSAVPEVARADRSRIFVQVDADGVPKFTDVPAPGSRALP